MSALGRTEKPVSSSVGRKIERDEAMGGLAKGLAIIENFTQRQPQLTVSEAAAATGATPAAARRCLRTLEDLGYVTYDGKYYRPTPRLVRLGAAYTQTAPLPILAQPCLVAVRDELDESASLAVLEDDCSVFIVARSEAARMVSTGVRLGTSLPAAATATGRVILASMSEDELDRALRRYQPLPSTAHSLITPSDIKDRVVRAREEGYSFTDEELEIGVRALAVPVKDVNGTARAAMSVSASAARVSMDEMVERFLPILKRQARRLGNML